MLCLTLFLLPLWVGLMTLLCLQPYDYHPPHAASHYCGHCGPIPAADPTPAPPRAGR